MKWKDEQKKEKKNDTHREKETFAESLKKEITENAYMPINACMYKWLVWMVGINIKEEK